LLCFRLLWEEEDEEEKLNKVETEIRNREQNKYADILKRFQSKPPLCCPHLFMDQKPRLDTS
jgi:hypothetical protein